MATDYTRLPNTIGKPTEGELSVAEQEDGGLFDTGDGTTGVGAPGTEGPKGDTGEPGATGDKGDPGPQGPRGYQGVSIEGPTGPEGDKGDTGLTGDTGIDGATGPNGPKGDMGTSGTDGTDGSTGPTGPEGPKGDIGATGTSVTGPAGPQGPKGDTGDASTVVGPTGPRGFQGPTGSSGNEGPKGDMGTQGETGGVGPEGPQGVQGITGMTGGTGSQGIKGATGPGGPEGNIGPTGARGTEGPKGQTGDKGDTGVQGASVTGEKGDTGAVGPSGPEGDVGRPGATGTMGEPGARGDTGNLTPSAIKTSYESNENTNAFTNLDEDLLDSAIQPNDLARALLELRGVGLSYYDPVTAYIEGDLVVENDIVFVRTGIDTYPVWNEFDIYSTDVILINAGKVWKTTDSYRATHTTIPSGFTFEPGSSTNSIWEEETELSSQQPSGNSIRWTIVKDNFTFLATSTGFADLGQTFSRGDIVEYLGSYYLFNRDQVFVSNTVLSVPTPGTDNSVWVPLSTAINVIQAEGVTLPVNNSIVNITRESLNINSAKTVGMENDFVILDSTGRISSSLLQSIRLSTILTFDTVAERNASTAEWAPGDIAIIITDGDNSKGSYIYTGSEQVGPTLDGDWTFLTIPTNFASVAQGNRADSAVQPTNLATALTAYTTTVLADSKYATAAQGGKADSALQQTNVVVNGNTLTIGNQNFTPAALSNEGIKSQYEANGNTNVFTDFDKDKLDGAIAEWNTNVEYSLNEDVTFEGNLYRFKEDFSAVIYEVSVNEFAIRNVNGIDQFVSVFEGGVKVVNSVLISGNDVTKNDDGSYTVQGSLKSYHSDPVLQDTTNETGSIIVSKTDHYGVVIQIHSTGENPTIDTAHWDPVTGGEIHGTFITDAERAKLAGIETGATTDQDLSSYTGAWVAVRQYLNNEQVSFEGKLYDNTEILIRQTYDVGVNEMEVQADNGIDDFIIINDEDNGSSLVIVNVNDARVLSGTNGGNYVVLIGHRKYTSIGVSRATGTLSATRTLANFEMRVDDVALAGESPIDKPLNWLQISLTEAELNAKLSTALGPYLTTVDHLSDGITEFNNLIDYKVGDLVYYKDPTNTSEEQIFYEVLLSSGAAGVDANGDPRTPLNDIGGPAGLNRFFRIVASALQGTKADDALNILDIKLDGDTTTTLSDATIAGSSSISFTSVEGVTKVFTVPTVVSANDGTITIEQNGNSVGAFTTNQSENETIKLLDTTTTVINTTVVNNATEYVKDTFYAIATQIKFTDTDGNVHYYEKYGEPEFYLGVWASIDPYLPTSIVSHNGFYYVASGNGATPGQEPNTGAVDGDGEQAWVLIDINPVDYSNTWKPLVPNHFEISANNGAATTATLNTLDIDGTNYVIPVGGGTTLPDQVGNAGKYLVTNGTALAWQPLGTGTPNPKLSTFDLFFGTVGAGGTDGGDGTETFELYTHGVFGAYYWFPNRGTGGEWANARLNADQTIKFDLAGNDT